MVSRRKVSRLTLLPATYLTSQSQVRLAPSISFTFKLRNARTAFILLERTKQRRRKDQSRDIPRRRTSRRTSRNQTSFYSIRFGRYLFGGRCSFRAFYDQDSADASQVGGEFNADHHFCTVVFRFREGETVHEEDGQYLLHLYFRVSTHLS